MELAGAWTLHRLVPLAQHGVADVFHAGRQLVLLERQALTVRGCDENLQLLLLPLAREAANGDHARPVVFRLGRGEPPVRGDELDDRIEGDEGSRARVELVPFRDRDPLAGVRRCLRLREAQPQLETKLVSLDVDGLIDHHDREVRGLLADLDRDVLDAVGHSYIAGERGHGIPVDLLRDVVDGLLRLRRVDDRRPHRSRRSARERGHRRDSSDRHEKHQDPGAPHHLSVVGNRLQH